MFTTEQSRTRTIENQLAEQLKQTWLMLFLGVTIGFVGLHFFVTRPTANELSKVKATLASVEQRLQTGSGHQAIPPSPTPSWSMATPFKRL